MGELRGGHPDLPPDEPDRPAVDRVRAPEPPADSNNDARALRQAWRRAEDPAFADPRVEVRYVTDQRPDTGPANLSPYRTSKDRPEPEPVPDGPAHRPPDLIPPRGEDLAEKDTPGASILSRLRKRALDKETLDDGIDTVKESGNTIDDAITKPQGPTHAQVLARPGPSMFETPNYGVKVGDTGATMIVAGILLGEGTRLAYRKMLEMKETRHARQR